MTVVEELEQLSKRHKAVKHRHSYHEFYGPLLEPIRHEPIKLLEIGIWRGGSLRMWKDFLPNARVFGIDISLSSVRMFDGDDRISAFHCNQANREALQKLMGQIGEMNVIIDDGSHVMEHQQVSFATLFPFVKPGGVYCIEDLQSSNPLYPIQAGDKNIEMVLKLQAECGVDANLMNTTHLMLYVYTRLGRFDSLYLTPEELTYLEKNVASIEIAHLSPMGITSSIRKKVA